MKRPSCWKPAIAAWGAVALLMAVCGCSQEASKARHLKRGEHYFAKGQYEEAIIEYLNVLRIEPTNSVAIRQLGMAYFERQDARRAVPFLLNAEQHAPEDLDIKQKVGSDFRLTKPEKKELGIK